MKYWSLMIGLAFVLGCQPKPPVGKIVAKIGDYVITKGEFEEAFKSSSYGFQDNAASRQVFLDNMINQKLIILDARAKGLDKNKDFLQMIQNFWEQSLLTVALREKSKDFSPGTTQISSQEAQAIYDQMVKDGKTDKSLNDVYPEIQSMLTRQKESEKLNQWVNDLRQKTTVEIHQEYLKPGLYRTIREDYYDPHGYAEK